MRWPSIYISNDVKNMLKFIAVGAAVLAGGAALFFTFMDARGFWELYAWSAGCALLIAGTILIIVPIVILLQEKMKTREQRFRWK